MDGTHVGLGDKSPTVTGGLRRASCEKTFSVVWVGAFIKAPVGENIVVSRLEFICISRLAVLLRDLHVIGRITGLGIPFSGSVMVDLLGFSNDNERCHYSGNRIFQFQKWRQFEETCIATVHWVAEGTKSWTSLSRLLFCVAAY